MVERWKATPALALLCRKKLLRDRLGRLGLPAEALRGPLRHLVRHRSIAASDVPELVPTHELEEAGLIVGERRGGIPTSRSAGGEGELLGLSFVDAVNLELTYDCNLRCPHCLQSGLRRHRGRATMPAVLARRVVHEAWFLGLVQVGLNLTGGEALGAVPELFELIAYARSLGVPTRLNTNSWWGVDEEIEICGRRFTSPEVLVETLRDCGLEMLAFSLDARVDASPALLERLVRTVTACEEVGFPYQLVCTAGPEEPASQRFRNLLERLPTAPRHMIPVPMSTVDLGAAAAAEDGRRMSVEDFEQLAAGAPCGWLGFRRPSFLHVDPWGGVRTCLYAPGLENVGNVRERSLTALVNGFGQGNDKEGRVARPEDCLHLILADVWKRMRHPCAACAALTRVADAWTRRTPGGHDPEALRWVNIRVARELNLERRSR